MSTTVLQTLIYCLVECPPIGKNKRHGELSRFTISSLFMIIAYSTGRPIIIPSHSTVGARHFSFFHKLEPNYNIDFAIHYERGVVNNILCSRRSLNKISVCIDVCFSSFFSREAIALYRRRSGLPTAPTNDVYWLIIKFTSFCPRLCYASDVEPKEGRIKRIRKRVICFTREGHVTSASLSLSLSDMCAANKTKHRETTVFQRVRPLKPPPIRLESPLVVESLTTITRPDRLQLLGEENPRQSRNNRIRRPLNNQTPTTHRIPSVQEGNPNLDPILVDDPTALPSNRPLRFRTQLRLLLLPASGSRPYARDRRLLLQPISYVPVCGSLGRKSSDRPHLEEEPSNTRSSVRFFGGRRSRPQ